MFFVTLIANESRLDEFLDFLNNSHPHLKSVHEHFREKSSFIDVAAIVKNRSSHPRCSVKKGVLRNFAKFTGKHLCQSLFFNKVSGLRPTELLQMTASEGK